MNLAEIGQIVHQRRRALGLSQDRLARLSGLSRATINQLESGAIRDLGAAKLLSLLGLLGLEFGAGEPSRPRNALQMASQTASVSYRTTLDPQALACAIIEGKLPEAFVPQIATLLDEAPLPLLVATIEEVALASESPPKTLWKHIVHWAHELQSPRPVWS